MFAALPCSTTTLKQPGRGMREAKGAKQPKIKRWEDVKSWGQWA